VLLNLFYKNKKTLFPILDLQVNNFMHDSLKDILFLRKSRLQGLESTLSLLLQVEHLAVYENGETDSL
jgi:hypothetical protein